MNAVHSVMERPSAPKKISAKFKKVSKIFFVIFSFWWIRCFLGEISSKVARKIKVKSASFEKFWLTIVRPRYKSRIMLSGDSIGNVPSRVQTRFTRLPVLRENNLNLYGKNMTLCATFVQKRSTILFYDKYSTAQKYIKFCLFQLKTPNFESVSWLYWLSHQVDF